MSQVDTGEMNDCLAGLQARRGSTARKQVQARSLSDLGVRSEASGRARTNRHDFEAPSHSTQREIGAIWAALPPPQ